MIAEISVNGKYAVKLIVSESSDISAFLKKGNNTIRITITSSMRNMLGPLHNAQIAEPTDYVGHQHFEFRGTWKGDFSPDFTNKYQTMPFGINSVILTDKYFLLIY